MIELGRLCVKIAGRDSGHKCVVVDVVDDNFVLIDGDVRRRKCNVKHLEPLKDVLKLKKGASHADVASEFKKLKLPVWETKPKQKSEKPKKQRKQKVKPEPAPKKPVEKKPAQKEVKKEPVPKK